MKKRKSNLRKRMLAVLLAAVMAAGMLSNAAPMDVLAAEPVPQAGMIGGGESEGWTLDADGRLTISSDTGMLNWYSSRDTSYNGTAYKLLVTSAVILEGVTGIEGSAFRNCSGLTKITIPEGVTTIGNSAFNGCSGLTGITIPEGVTDIGSSAFRNCSGLTKITIPEGVTTLGYDIFNDCSGLTEITIPESVTTIKGSAFRRCTKLTEITIPESVTDIGGSVFDGCSGLEIVMMQRKTPPALSTNVFNNCGFVQNKTQGIHVPESTAQAYQAAWTDWTDYITDGDIASGEGWTLATDGKLTISSKQGMTNWRSTKLTYNIKLLVKSAVLQNGVTSIIDDAFPFCSSLEKITIPESVTSIGQAAFRNCSKLTEVTIPGSVESIGEMAFGSCSKLTEITIPAGVTSIGLGAFNACRNLTKVTFREGVKSIGDYMFSHCSSLEKITIPASVTDIREKAFRGCTRLETVTMLGEPPTLSAHVFGQPDAYPCGFVLNNTQGIRVPEGKVQDYKDAWTDWADYITDSTTPAEEHKHNDVAFTAWTKTDSLPSSGAYYLTKDVEVSSQMTISDTLILCLNGCKIDAKQSGRIFWIESGGSLTLYDCDSEKKGTLTGGKMNVLIIQQPAAVVAAYMWTAAAVLP